MGTGLLSVFVVGCCVGSLITLEVIDYLDKKNKDDKDA